MDNIEHLQQVYQNQINDEQLVFEKIKIPENEYYFIPMLEYANVTYALYNLYIAKNFNQAKGKFFKAARIAEFTSNAYDWHVMDNGMYQITYALLSDNEDLISRYAVLRNKVNGETTMPYQYSNSVQNLLLNDMEKLDWNIRCLERFTNMSKFAGFKPLVPLLTAFKNDDENAIREVLKQMIVEHNKRNKDPFYSKYLSMDTSCFTKLAWRRGIEIDLGSPLVPIELMPVRPLDYYPDYDFLNK